MQTIQEKSAKWVKHLRWLMALVLNCVICILYAIRIFEDENTKHSSNCNFKLKLIGISFSQRWPTTIGFSDRRIFGIFKHLCIELRPSKWSIKWGCPGSECNRPQLAWFGHIFNEKIPWRCHWTITCAIPSTIFTIFFGSFIR